MSPIPGERCAGAEYPPETLKLAALHSPVEIITDRWGVAHIYAQTEDDLFFAQGFDAARQRLFQFELFRRQATGTCAEILGRREVERDIGARLIRFRGNLTQELNHYHPRGKLIIESFVRGINAWIEQTELSPALLPYEFQWLGIKPGRWTADVVVSRHQGLMQNVTRELDLGRAVARLGAERVKELVWLHPGDPDLTLDAAIPGRLLEPDILQRYRRARAPVRFLPEDVLATFRRPPSATERSKDPAAARHGSTDAEWLVDRVGTDSNDIGSNNWVVSRKLSEDGGTLMANDPHRALQVPSLRYFVHLHAPGWNVIGGGEPVLPGVSIGHNEYGAWGLTTFHIDAEDLYVYETNPDNPLEYRYREGWEPMTIVRETITVRGEEPVPVELKFTRHGPVLYEDRQQHAAYALRAGWLELGGAPYLASLRMNSARNWEEFRDACSFSRIPGENMVWADRHGNIGWQVVGVAPIRPNWHGLVPVPGDGRFEWDGYLPGRALPHVLNPEQGFWNTSNENLIPLDYPHRDCLGWSWADPYRSARVRELLATGRKLNLMDMIRAQHDELSIPARTLIPLLRGLKSDKGQTQLALDRLQAWDFVLDRDSVAAGIYAMWERRLQNNLRDLLVPESARSEIGSLAMKRMIDWLLLPDGKFGSDPLAGRDAMLLRSLDEAIQELSKRFGADPDKWQYGQTAYKHVRIQHPLSDAVNDELRTRLNVGPLPRGGNSYTVNNTSNADNQASGATFRVIISTSEWDHAVATNSPGQSGIPENSHYSDLFPLWNRGSYFPLFYSRNKVESVRERTTQLVPH